MKRVFDIPKPFPVPDETLVSPFLNPKDSESGLPFDLLKGFSLAAGTIEPGICSKIHFTPHSVQVTFLRKGTLTVKMKGSKDSSAYPLVVKENQSVITEPNTLLQLINNEKENCEVLYIVSPPYIYEKIKKVVVYDDSVVLDETWDELKAAGWRISKKIPSKDERQKAENRLRNRSA